AAGVGHRGNDSGTTATGGAGGLDGSSAASGGTGGDYSTNPTAGIAPGGGGGGRYGTSGGSVAGAAGKVTVTFDWPDDGGCFGGDYLGVMVGSGGTGSGCSTCWNKSGAFLWTLGSGPGGTDGWSWSIGNVCG